jgi:hypothetical protein
MGEGKHVRFTVTSRGARARAVAFGTGGRLPVAEGERAQATFALEVNEWNGVTEPRLVLRRAQPALQEAAAHAPGVEGMSAAKPPPARARRPVEHAGEQLALAL